MRLDVHGVLRQLQRARDRLRHRRLEEVQVRLLSDDCRVDVGDGKTVFLDAVSNALQ